MYSPAQQQRPLSILPPVMGLPPRQAATAAAASDYSGRRGDRVYKLVVEQQPIRARMCGFGDKDRRPITSPPCIRLVVCDAHSGKEIDPNEVDSTFFVLTVDLWDSEGSREVNLVRHSSGAPTVSISSSTTTSYPPPLDRPMYVPQTMITPVVDQYGRSMSGTPNFSQPFNAPPMPANYYPPSANPSYVQGYASQSHYAGNPVQLPMQVQAPPSAATGMFTRNLIGSLTVNAFRLTDTAQKSGFWFVLQDLSVRTEGTFRLKMNFVDVGSGLGNNMLNTGVAPVLATCFSEPFQVFSAKKFPGVIESTPLSKAFAGQGIKIPIRKDGVNKTINNQAEYDAD